jgi:hypothetical protein
MHDKTVIGNRYRHKVRGTIYHAIARAPFMGNEAPDDGSAAFFRIWGDGYETYIWIEAGPRSLGDRDTLFLEIELTIQRSGPTDVAVDWVIYHSDEGSFHARPLAEFNDGRFEKIRRKNR